VILDLLVETAAVPVDNRMIQIGEQVASVLAASWHRSVEDTAAVADDQQLGW
jgi:hypothetical protein